MTTISFSYRYLTLLAALLLWGQVYTQSIWSNPIVKSGRLGSPLVEVSPFVFNDHLYLLENNQKFWDVPGAKPGDYFHEDEVRIRDLTTDSIVSVPLQNHGFATIFVWEGHAYVFAGNYGQDKPWRHMTEITMTKSEDLVNWSDPITVLKAKGEEAFFNTAVCRGKTGFVLLYETNDPRWKPFTFRYVESSDLVNWSEVRGGAMYGTKKYVGGPALYYEGDYYYTLYLESLGGRNYETRITRSKNLREWVDAPAGRSFVTFDTTHRNLPLIDPSIAESNASDVELCYYGGETILYFTGSDQSTAGDLQRASYAGTPQELFEHFFTYSRKPSPEQLSYQDDQMGAFLHFGPATYLASDMLEVPSADIFDPGRLDADQWAKTAKSFGAKYAVLTAKHHNGFCLWPTKTSTYSVKNSPWRDGAGDVVQEFVEACRNYDLKVGLYLSGGDKYLDCYSTPDPQGERKMVGDIHRYFPVFLEQLRELLTEYGRVDYLWFDGAYDPFGWDVKDPITHQRYGTVYGDAIAAMVSHLQPETLVMGGTKPSVRWAGSEKGRADYPLWNVVQPGEGFDLWVGEEPSGWIPAEANLHTRDTWFWSPDSDQTLPTVDHLMKCYLESIGRGANLMVNMTPDTSGLIPEAEVNRLAHFGSEISAYFSSLIGSAEYVAPSKEAPYSIKLSKPEQVDLIVLEENIINGQSIKEYHVDARVADTWVNIAQGESIGSQRIQKIDPVVASEFRLVVHSSISDHELRSFSLYLTPQ